MAYDIVIKDTKAFSVITWKKKIWIIMAFFVWAENHGIFISDFIIDKIWFHQSKTRNNPIQMRNNAFEQVTDWW